MAADKREPYRSCDKQGTLASNHGKAVGLCGLPAGHTGECVRVGVDFPA